MADNPSSSPPPWPVMTTPVGTLISSFGAPEAVIDRASSSPSVGARVDQMCPAVVVAGVDANGSMIPGGHASVTDDGAAVMTGVSIVVGSSPDRNVVALAASPKSASAPREASSATGLFMRSVMSDASSTAYRPRTRILEPPVMRSSTGVATSFDATREALRR